MLFQEIVTQIHTLNAELQKNCTKSGTKLQKPFKKWNALNFFFTKMRKAAIFAKVNLDIDKK